MNAAESSHHLAAALARKHKAELVTGDLAFKEVEGEIKIAWLDRRQ
jgi:hypothetical protein